MLVCRSYGEHVNDRTDWMNPLNILRMKQAVGKRRKSWTLENGKKFTIRYLPNERIWVSPQVGMYPCGSFTIQEVLNYTFEGRPLSYG